MPHARIETNVHIGKDKALELAGKLSGLCAGLLGKPEGFVQACVVDGMAMTFGGSAEPTAYVTLHSIGLDSGACAGLAAELCAFLQEQLAIPQDRVFIDFADLKRELFGWNGKTFA